MPLVVYSVLRLLLFAAALGVLWMLQMRGWLLVLVAAAIAFMVSYLALRGPREAAAVYLAERAEHSRRTGERFSREIEDDAALEDAAVDAARADETGSERDVVTPERSEREPDPEQDAVRELEEPRPRQDRNQ
ncbi:DUF4229 domain-containing protein [Cellulosimicrobium arenosum]|uniref:DUF4229 domain-containing protein n=1 Tax=Cellulosimicrobium arenosum TaxID=2708133 RepID=A0A927GAE8_9MICO|nr:DUF4229 domain-containing protein [Cellulosimicrobium arenosum]